MLIKQSIYRSLIYFFFFFNDTATTEIYTLSLHDALPICIERVVRDGREEEAAQDDRLPADPIREPAEEDERRRGEQQRRTRDEGGVQHVGLLHLLDEIQRPELAAVPHYSLADHHDARDEHVSDVLTPERFAPRIARRLPLGLDGLEDRRLLQLQSDIDGDRDHEQREQERDAPSPRVERFGPQQLTRGDDDEQGHDDSERRRGLQPAGVVAPLLIRRVLCDVGDRAAVLAAQAQPLDQAQEQEDETRRRADLGVARHDPDERRRQAHAAQRNEEGVLAAHDVADAAEHEGPERPDQEPGGERPDGADERASTGTLLEELDRQEGGEAPEDVEVVPLDHVANCRRHDDAAQFLHRQRRSGHKLLGPVVEA